MKRLAFAFALVFALGVAVTPAYALTTTKMVGSINKHTCTYSSPAVFKGTLMTASGKRLAYKPVELQRNGVKVAAYRTDANGNIAKSVKYRGYAKWRYVFKGDTSYAKSYTTAQYTNAVKVYSGTLSPIYTEPDPDTGDVLYIFGRDFRLGAVRYQIITDHKCIFAAGQQDLTHEDDNIITSRTWKPSTAGLYSLLWANSSAVGGDSSLHVYIW